MEKLSQFAHKSEKWTKQDEKQALFFNEAEAQTEPLGASQQQDDFEDTITVTYTRKKNARDLPNIGSIIIFNLNTLALIVQIRLMKALLKSKVLLIMP